MTQPLPTSLEIINLTCERNERRLFAELSIHLFAGEVLQIEGKNGCGKTSLLRILCGLSLATDGEVRWNGARIDKCREDYFSQLNYIGHQHGLKVQLTASENLRLAVRLHQSPSDQTINEALQHVGLSGFENVLTQHLSAGQQRRVALARLLLKNTQLWILDEPFSALDSQGRSIVEAMLVEHAQKGGMAVVTSHQPIKLATIPTKQLMLR